MSQDNSQAASTGYEHLEPRPRSNYRQLWIMGRHIRAEALYRLTVGREPLTAEEVAADYDLPLAAVLEAIEYAVANQALLARDRAQEEAPADPAAAGLPRGTKGGGWERA